MKAYVAIGSNLGAKRDFLSRAVRTISGLKGVRCQAVSPLYRTEPIGSLPQPEYLNGVLSLKIKIPPQELMRNLLEIERRLGRVRRVKWGPRVIDLDLIAVGKKILRTKTLTIPHPRYHQRRFVLVPFCDVAPRFVHPRFGRQNRSLLRKLTPLGQKVTMAAKWNGTRFSPSKIKRKTKSPSSH